MEEHIGVSIIVLDKTGRVLLGKRRNGYKAGTYGFPGGRIETREKLSECGKRELFEETGLIAKSLSYLGVIRELQTDYNFIHFVYTCDKFSGIPSNSEPEKCEGWEWYSMENLPENILNGHKAALEIYLNKKTPALKDIVN